MGTESGILATVAREVAALVSSPPETPKERLAQLLGGRVHQGRLILPAARYGATFEAQRMALAAAGKPSAKMVSELRRLGAEYARLVGELNVVAARKPLRDAEAHRRELSRRAVSGEAVAGLDGWGAGEFASERETLMSSLRSALIEVSDVARTLVRGHVEKAVAALPDLIEIELHRDAEHARTFGFTPSGPSGAARTLGACYDALLALIEPGHRQDPGELLVRLGVEA